MRVSGVFKVKITLNADRLHYGVSITFFRRLLSVLLDIAVLRARHIALDRSRRVMSWHSALRTGGFRVVALPELTELRGNSSVKVLFDQAASLDRPREPANQNVQKQLRQ